MRLGRGAVDCDWETAMCRCQHRENVHDPETAKCTECEECEGFQS
jgi:hypothetical protein